MVYDLNNIPKTKNEALLIGSVKYFTGKPCKNKHVAPRYTNTGICYKCKQKQMLKDWENHKTRIIKHNKKSYLKHKNKRLYISKLWAKNNIEKSKQIKQKWRKNNQIKIKKFNKKYGLEMRQNPFYRLSKNTSKAIWAFLNGLKGFRHWEDIIGYKFNDLKIRLEKQFTPEMTWNNYGSYWEIDHIIPLNYFKSLNLDTDTLIRKAWHLQNLRPLNKIENNRKQDKIIQELFDRVALEIGLSK